MIRLASKWFSRLSWITFVFFLVFGSFNLDLNALTINQNEELIERIARDFSKKFCNGVAFGLSEESAMNFAMKENMAIFKKKKGIESIDNKVLVEKVIISVGDKCGYKLNLSEDVWVSNIENFT